jgi:hypothetical protein
MRAGEDARPEEDARRSARATVCGLAGELLRSVFDGCLAGGAASCSGAAAAGPFEP